jgi:hypothetical protein
MGYIDRASALTYRPESAFGLKQALAELAVTFVHRWVNAGAACAVSWSGRWPCCAVCASQTGGAGSRKTIMAAGVMRSAPRSGITRWASSITTQSSAPAQADG